MTTCVSYAQAGVNIKAGNEAVRRIKPLAESTFSKNVVTNIGSFGALYDLGFLKDEYESPMLVQSMDGVGTKCIVARMMNRFDNLGFDLVSACVNDIVVMGARPLTFLDYVAFDKLEPNQVEILIRGMSEACREAGISLVGGELAEMPGTYQKDEIDLVGIVTGVVEKSRVINGQKIAPGDVIYGLASSGLHTNGYSLARKLLFEIAGMDVNAHSDELGSTVGEALLRPHLNYQQPVLGCLDAGVNIKGMAHITGGGFIENVPRILPAGVSVVIDSAQWPLPAIFTLLKRVGNLTNDEAFTTFNMGIGLVMVVDKANALALEQKMSSYGNHQLYQIGEVTKAEQHTVRII